MEHHDYALVVGLIAAWATVMAALIAATAAFRSGRLTEARKTYGEAVRAATRWRELLYRVRRREAGEEKEIRALFHQAQDELLYYRAWVGADSAVMAKSYARLVDGVQDETRALIQQAWTDEVRPVPGNAREGEAHPDITPLIDRFLADVRKRLSFWPWVRPRA